MKFLVAFVAVLGYASANIIAPLGLGISLGDAQGAAIDATVVAQNNARAWTEPQIGAIEAQAQRNAELTRQVVDTGRTINENALWSRVVAGQDVVAAAQSQAAALGGAVASRAGAGAWGVGAPWGVGASWGVAAPWGVAAAPGLLAPGLGLGAW